MHRFLGIAILLATIACLVPFFLVRHHVDTGPAGAQKETWKVGVPSPWLERTTTKAKLGAASEFQWVTETHVAFLSWSWLFLFAGVGLFYLRGKISLSPTR